jgi:transcriptional regulator with XRE-family HTH domain
MSRTESMPPTDIDSSCPLMIGRRVIADRTLHRISRYLMFARIEARLTQAQVASRMGTTASAISRLESAAGHRPTVTTLEHYANAVGCSLEIRLVPLRR